MSDDLIEDLARAIEGVIIAHQFEDNESGRYHAGEHLRDALRRLERRIATREADIGESSD